MSDDKPFFSPDDSDKTIMKPMPGGRARAAATPGNNTPPPTPGYSQPAMAAAPVIADITLDAQAEGNVITRLATPLLGLATKLRQTTQLQDSDGLYQQISQSIKQYETQLLQAGLPQNQVLTARYIICTFIDEMILSTPWGPETRWSTQPLLSLFHNEAHGGSKFFDIVKQLQGRSTEFGQLLELCYICLSLGFEGKYRVSNQGRAELAAIQDQLFQQLRQLKGESSNELAANWRGLDQSVTPLSDNRLLLLVAGACIALMLLVYTGFLFSLNRQSDPVAIKSAAIGAQIPTPIKPVVQPESPALDLAQLLQTAITQGHLTVTQDSRGQKITLAGADLFQSGSTSLTASKIPVLTQLAQALAQVPGNLLFIGHTDDIPIRSLKYPSNWQLSKARAKAIAEAIKPLIGTRTISVEGMADMQPLVANDSAANRAINRRVEIILLKP